MAESSMLGTLDFLVIGGVVGIALYYFVFRKPKKEVPTFKKLTVGYVSILNAKLSMNLICLQLHIMCALCCRSLSFS